MNGIYYSSKLFVNNWALSKCLDDKLFYDSHFVAALVLFIATVERTVNAVFSLSQSNPVTASNSYRFGRKLTMDTFLKLANDNAIGVNPSDPTTVVFFCKNDFQNTQSGQRNEGIAMNEGLLS